MRRWVRHLSATKDKLRRSITAIGQLVKLSAERLGNLTVMIMYQLPSKTNLISVMVQRAVSISVPSLNDLFAVQFLMLAVLQWSHLSATHTMHTAVQLEYPFLVQY